MSLPWTILIHRVKTSETCLWLIFFNRFANYAWASQFYRRRSDYVMIDCVCVWCIIETDWDCQTEIGAAILLSTQIKEKTKKNRVRKCWNGAMFLSYDQNTLGWTNIKYRCVMSYWVTETREKTRREEKGRERCDRVKLQTSKKN